MEEESSTTQSRDEAKQQPAAAGPPGGPPRQERRGAPDQTRRRRAPREDAAEAAAASAVISERLLTGMAENVEAMKLLAESVVRAQTAVAEGTQQLPGWLAERVRKSLDWARQGAVLPPDHPRAQWLQHRNDRRTKMKEAGLGVVGGRERRKPSESGQPTLEHPLA